MPKLSGPLGGQRSIEGRSSRNWELVDYLGGCLDVSWTKELSRSLCWDERHNNESFYRVTKEHLLKIILFLPKRNKKLGHARCMRDLWERWCMEARLPVWRLIDYEAEHVTHEKIIIYLPLDLAIAMEPGSTKSLIDFKVLGNDGRNLQKNK